MYFLYACILYPHAVYVLDFFLRNLLALVIQKVHSAIHWTNLYALDNAIGFTNTYPLESDLSSR